MGLAEDGAGDVATLLNAESSGSSNLGANRFFSTFVQAMAAGKSIINIEYVSGAAQIAAWLFLIAAEAIASTEGLGFRIFLVRRYLAMDVILPYVRRQRLPDLLHQAFHLRLADLLHHR